MGGKSKTAFSLHFKVKFVNMNKPRTDAVIAQLLCAVQFLLLRISFELF